METTIISKAEWSERTKKSPYTTAFHDICLIDLFLRNLGGEYILFFSTESNKEWLTCAFTGNPWNISQSTFTTSSVGYGGPLPLHEIQNWEEEIQNIKSVIHEIGAFINKTFIRGQLYPSAHWVNALEDNIYDFGKTLIIKLNDDLDYTFNFTISGNARTAIRKAQNSAVSIKEVSNLHELSQAHELITSTQKTQGAHYITPFTLLKDILFDNTIPAKIFIAVFDDIIIGSVVLLENHLQSFHWLHGWDRKFAKVCGNQLLMWAMLQNCIKRSSFSLNLGSSYTSGQIEAKKKWGAEFNNIIFLSKENIY